jgi:hypothetical protein
VDIELIVRLGVFSYAVRQLKTDAKTTPHSIQGPYLPSESESELLRGLTAECGVYLACGIKLDSELVQCVPTEC